MSAELYLDGKEHESEIKQVIGDAYSSHNLSDDDVLIIGKIGLLITGRGCSRYEPLAVSYLTMICRERFVKYFYARVFLMDQTLRKIRDLINHYDEVCAHAHLISPCMSCFLKVASHTLTLELTLYFVTDRTRTVSAMYAR